MATRMITRTYKTFNGAARAVIKLQDNGIPVTYDVTDADHVTVTAPTHCLHCGAYDGNPNSPVCCCARKTGIPSK